jgi:hypothetical protein
MCEFKTPKYEVIEVPFLAAARSVNFPDQPNLRNAQIVALDLVPPDVSTLSPETFSVMAPLAALQAASVELWEGNFIAMRRKPVLALNQVQVPGGATPFVQGLQQITPRIISWTKCQIIFSNPPALAGTICFGVYYYDEGQK